MHVNSLIIVYAFYNEIYKQLIIKHHYKHICIYVYIYIGFI